MADEHAYRSADQAYIKNLTKLLKQRGIPFEFMDETIRYNDTEKAEFDKAQSAFDSAMSAQFVDPDVRNYFHTLLNTEGVEYIEADHDAGSWTIWWPGSEGRKMNILNQVSEHRITLQLEEDSDCETNSSDAHTKPSFIQDALNKNTFQ